MTIEQALKYGESQIVEKLGIEKKSDAKYFLCDVLKKNLAFLLINKNYQLNKKEEETFLNYISQRLKNRPFQYIIGRQEFMSLNFKVDERVLIPRQDTEILVEEIIKWVGKRKVRILDLGTGSGCIAISLAHYLEDASVVAVDISEKALELAEENAISLNVKNKITFLKYDILKEACSDWKDTFDVVVSNPPYISKEDEGILDREVKEFEPDMALFAEDNGLLFYNHIISKWNCVLKKNGMLAFEVGKGQYRQVSDMVAARFSSVKVVNDYSGIERVVLGENSI